MKACAKSYQTFPDDVAFSPYTGKPLVSVDLWEPGGLEGETIGGYTLERRVFSDVLGEVYRASRKKRHFSLRVFYPNVTLDEERVDQLLADLERLRTATHPSVVRVIAAERDADGRVWVASEWVEGRSLREVLSEKTHLDQDQAIPIARLVLDALAALHELDLVHGYLSPDTVFIERASNGRKTVRLLDAGFWRLLHVDDIEEMADGHPEFFKEAADYLPPEVVEGTRPEASSDVYSTAVLTFEMLTGRPPFHSPTPAATFKRQQIEDPIPVTLARDTLQLRDGVQDILSLALGKRPTERFANTRACLTALGAVMPPTEMEDEGFLPDEAFPRPAPALGAPLPGRDTEVDEEDGAESAPAADATDADAPTVTAEDEAAAEGDPLGADADDPPGDDADEEPRATILGVSPKVVELAQQKLAQQKLAEDAAGEEEAAQDGAAEAETSASGRKRGKKRGKKKGKKRKKSAETAAQVAADEATAPGDADPKTEVDAPTVATEVSESATRDEAARAKAPAKSGAETSGDAAKPAAAAEKPEPAAVAEDGAAKRGKRADSDKRKGRKKKRQEMAAVAAIDLDDESDHALAFDDDDMSGWFATGGDEISARAFDHEAEEYARRSNRRTMVVAVVIVALIVGGLALWIASSSPEEEEEAETEEGAPAPGPDVAGFEKAFASAIATENIVGPESAYDYLRKIKGAVDETAFPPYLERFRTAAGARIESLRERALVPSSLPDFGALVALRERAAAAVPTLPTAPVAPSEPTDGEPTEGQPDGAPDEGPSEGGAPTGEPPAQTPASASIAHRHALATGALATVDGSALGLGPTAKSLDKAAKRWTDVATIQSALADFATGADQTRLRDDALDSGAQADYFAALASGREAVPPGGRTAMPEAPPADPAPTEDGTAPEAPVDGAPTDPGHPADTTGMTAGADGALVADGAATDPAATDPAPGTDPAMTEPVPTDSAAAAPVDPEATDPAATSTSDPAATTPPEPAPEPTPEPKPEPKIDPEPKPDPKPKPDPEPKVETPKVSARELSEQGYATLKAGKSKDAEKLFRQALKVDKRYARAHAGLGEIAWDARDFSAAAGHYEKAVAASSKTASYYIKLGNCHMKLGSYAEAVKAFEKAEQYARDSKTRTVAQKRIEGAKAKLGQ